MEMALTTFDANLPANPKVKIVTAKKGKGRILPDGAGGATRAAQHFGFDHRVSEALANDEPCWTSSRKQNCGSASPRRSALLAPVRLCVRKCYSAACCCASTDSAPTQVSSECAVEEAQIAMTTCSTFGGVMSGGATQGSYPAGVQRYFPGPQPCFVGRGHDGLCIGLEEIRRLGSEFDYRVGTRATEVRP
jgi:hypothetical protein